MQKSATSSIASAAALLAIACGSPPASRAAAELEQGDRAELDLLPEGAPPERVLRSMAKHRASGLIAVGPAMLGNLAEGARGDHLSVLRTGFCYRVLGAGDEAVQDMDLFLYDPTGVQVQQDASEDRIPILGSDAELCPAQSGAFRIQVFMYRGGGAYALRLYRTP